MATCSTINEVKVQEKKRGFRIDPWILAILVFAFAIRLYGIESPLSDFSSWRQVDTASIARNFAEHDFNVFHPQLEYDGPGPNYGQLELQITTFFIAILFKLGGAKDLFARIIPVLFFTMAVFYLYLLVKRYTDRTTANLTALVFSTLPMGVYYSRAVQPEATMLLFGIASLYYFSSWAEKQTGQSYAMAVFTGVLSVLAKLPNIFLFLPVFAIAYGKFGKRVFKDRRVILYFVIIVAVTAVYFGYLSWLVRNFGSPYDYHNYIKPGVYTGKFVTNITKQHVLPQFITAFQTPEASEYFTKFVPGLALTQLGLLLFVVGFLPIGTFGRNLENIRPFYAWLAAILIYMLTLVAIIRIDYYLVPLLPIASFFIARVLAYLGRYKAGWLAVAVFVAIIGYQSYTLVSPLYEQDTTVYKYGLDLKNELRPNEPVIIGSYNPVILYYSGHRGWRTTNITLAEIEFLRSEGAGYFIPLSARQDRDLALYLKDGLTKHVTKSGCVYYDLKESTESVSR